MQVLTYTVRIEPAEECGYDVCFPAPPRCVTQRDTYEEAVAMAHGAIEGFLEALMLTSEPVTTAPPLERPIRSLYAYRRHCAQLHVWCSKKCCNINKPAHPGDVDRYS
jgi:predicted RNase H-like HicB family nuclease